MLSHLKFYFDYVLPYRKKLLWSGLYFFLKRVPTLAVPIVIMIFVDNYIPRGNLTSMLLLAAAVIVMLFFHVLYHTSYSLEANAGLVKNISKDIRNHMVHRLQILSAGYLNRNHSGRLFSKIMVDVEKLETFGLHFFDIFFNSLFTLTMTAIVLGAVNWRLFLLYLAFAPVYGLIYWVFFKILFHLQHELRVASERVTRTIGSFIQTQSLARSHGEEAYELARVQKAGDEEIVKIKRLRTAEALFGSINAVISEMALLSVVAAGAYGVIRGNLTLGQLILFLQFINLIIDLIKNILNFFPEFTAFSEAVVSIKEITDSPDQELNEGKIKLTTIKGGIVFQNVTFGHKPEAILFRDLSVKITPGQTVALVGGSGSGKTTFVNLVLGLYRTNSGVIKLDGQPISSLDMRIVRRQIAVVTQEAIIFTGSVKDNIIYAKRVSNQLEIEQAAKDAHAFDFINGLEKKFDTLIGEGGQPLSGGQKQRIAIARALLRQPKILILDEATSALDSESEEEVQKALEEIQGKQTTLIIAHRLSTVIGADRILVFKNGKIIEDGKHQDLVALGGEYAKLVELQTSGL